MKLHYLVSSFPESSIQVDREVFISKAEINRQFYLIENVYKALFSNIRYVSLGYGSSAGIFNKSIEPRGSVILIALLAVNFPLVKWFFSFFSFVNYLIFNLKRRDVIVVYNVHPVYSIPLIFIRLFSDIKIISQIEDFYSVSDPRFKYFKFFYKLSYFYSSLFVFSSSGVLSRYSIITNKTLSSNYFIHSGYSENPPIFEPLPKCNLTYFFNDTSIDTSFKVLYSGGFDAERGLEAFISDFSKMNFSNRVTLIITGNFDLINFPSISTSPNTSIVFLGYINDVDYSKLLFSVDLCVCPQNPSVTSNFPSKISSYLSFGCNVISTNAYQVVSSNYSSLIKFYDGSYLSLFSCIESSINSSRSTSFRNNRISNFNSIINKLNSDLINFISSYIFHD